MEDWALDFSFALQCIGGFALVQDSRGDMWIVLGKCKPAFEYKKPSDVHKLLGIEADVAKSPNAPCKSVRKYLIDQFNGSGSKSDKQTTLLLAFDYLHHLLCKCRQSSGQTQAQWRRRPFTDLATLQVPSPLQFPQVCVKPGLPFRTKSAPF